MTAPVAVAANAVGAVLLVLATMACGADPSDAVTGEQVYMANCASCHAPVGSGGVGTRLNDGVTVARLTDAQMTAVVADGVRTMPANSGKLTATQIAAVVAYVRYDLQQP